jgi:transposase
MNKDEFIKKISELEHEIITVKAERSELEKKVITIESKVVEIEEDNDRLRAENARLEHRLAEALHALFGRSSEKAKVNDPEEDAKDVLPSNEEAAAAEDTEAQITVAEHKRKKKNKKEKRPLPAWLPRENIIYDLLDEQKTCNCGQCMHKIGEVISEKLEFIPAAIKVLRLIRLKYGCRNCESNILTAEMPKQPIPKSIASAGLLAHTLESKFDKHLPLYRQEKIWQDAGVDILRGTLANWVLKCAALFEPLYILFRDKIIESSYAQADETTIQVLHEENKKASSNSYMWTYSALPTVSSNLSCVVFEYQASRGGYHASNFLKEFSGYLQTDGYSGYNAIKKSQSIRGMSCWAHARRHFMNIIKIAKGTGGSKNTGQAEAAVNYINKLYSIEKKIKDLPYSDIVTIRQERSKPILSEFKVWLDALVDRVPPQSSLGKAVQYVLERWDELNVYLEHGYLHIDTNYIENKIRPIALGRKNFLFCNTPKGADAAAIIYTLIANARIHGLNVYKYLKHVLTKMPLANTLDHLEALLPWNLSAESLDSS